MLLLVTDTSGKDGFVGLVRAGEGLPPQRIEVIEEVPLAGGTFSAQLVPQVSELLKKHEFGKTDIGAFIVVSGPGSFTGLRIGLAAIKALAEILQRPIVPVSVLHVLATFSPSVAAFEGVPDRATVRYAVALDAGRGEAFVGEFETSPHRDRYPTALKETLLSLDKLAALLDSGAIQWISTPDHAIYDAVAMRASDVKKRHIRRAVRRPRSEEMATVGYQKLRSGETVTPEQLEANYIRRTDAEIFSKPTPAS